MTEIVGALVRCKRFYELADQSPEFLHCSFGALAQGSFEFRECHFDWIEVWRIGGQIANGCEREAARQRKKEQFTALLHHISVDTLRTAFYALKSKAAPGVDGMTWHDYEADLELRIEDLHGRVHRGAYRPQPSRRAYIDKADGKQRPLAIAALEDKIVQGATVMVLNAIYEGDFVGFSYGFRPGRGPHDALDALSTAIKTRKVNWILDADIRNFFGAVSQDWLVRFLEHRIGDKRIIRLIQKWLRAGILEDGVVTVDDRGTGQGSVMAPRTQKIILRSRQCSVRTAGCRAVARCHGQR